MDAMSTDRLRELARDVAAELQRHPDWDSDACALRDTFDAFVDAALSKIEDEETLRGWLA